MRYLREGESLIVWRLDRLGRNMRSIVNTLHELTERGVTVRSLHDGVDTSTSTGLFQNRSGAENGVRAGRFTEGDSIPESGSGDLRATLGIAHDWRCSF